MNMASKSKEVHVTEICANCKSFIFNFGVGGEREGLRENQATVREEDFGVDDIEKGIARMRIWTAKKDMDIGKDAEGNSKIKPLESMKEKRPIEEYGVEGKKVQSFSALGSAGNKEQEQRPKTGKEDAEEKATKASQTLSLFGNLVHLFKVTSETPEVERLDDVEPIETWTEVDEDPDWAKVDGKNEEQEVTKSDSDDGLWISVKSTLR